jgi:DNA-binding FadR family transcriptional regulator
MIRPLPPRPSATTAAEQALRSAIVSGELAPGDRLPPERELSARFGISRLTLRAALATLAASGLIAVRQGSGYTVRDVRETGGMDLLPGLVEHAVASHRLPAVAADLLRLRRHVAAGVLDALVERPPSAAARRAVHAAIDRFAAVAAAGDVDAIAEADLAIVRALLDATGSLILRVCLNPIVGVLRNSPPLRAAIYAEPAANLAGWRALASWLDRPDAAAIPILLGVLAQRDRLTTRRLGRGKSS